MSDSKHMRPGEFLARLPLPATDRWSDGVFDIEVFERAGLTLEFFAPRGIDRQTLHSQDELYFVIAGNAVLRIDGIEHTCAAGDALFVPARTPHHFIRISDDFTTWAVFWGATKA
jgi:mannose-6-phosphate isomerase-like protein (cupin superfamily)